MNSENSAGPQPWTDRWIDHGDLEPEDDGYQKPSALNPATGKLYLASDQCHDCVFAKAGRCLDLGPGRLKELAGDLRRRDDFLLCHNSYEPLGPVGAQPAICRGFFDAYGVEITAIRMAKILGLLVEIDPPAGPATTSAINEEKDQ